MSNTIAERVSAWNAPKNTRVNGEALSDFQADPSRTPADYIKAGLKGYGVWGAVYSAWYQATSGAVVHSKHYVAIGKNYQFITNHEDLDTMTKHLEDILAGVKAEEASQDEKDNAEGKAIADSMKDILKEAKKASNYRAIPTEDNIKAAEALLAFATSNLARFNLAKQVKASK